MCGIWGYWHRDGAPALSEESIRKATDVMRPRGPDDFGCYRSEAGIALGFRRLSIIDLTSGRQPLCNEDATVWVVLNGEIYNFRNLREELQGLGHRFQSRSDTEVIVHGYEQWGEAVFEHLAGMFGIAIWDERKRRLVLARDRMGIKPVYYLDAPKIFAFASDPRSFVDLPKTHAAIDQEALALYLFYGYVPAPWSIYEGVRKLRPGEVLCVAEQAAQKRRFWHLQFAPESWSMEEAEKRFASLFAEVVSEHLVADVPVGAFLSGGMDSTAVVQAASEISDRPLLTFNIAFADPRANEASFARFAADTLKTRHHELQIAADPMQQIPAGLAAFAEPFGDPAAAPNHELARVARTLCTVALSGDGGDEILAGYSLRRAQIVSLLRRLPTALRRLGTALPCVGELAALSLHDYATIYAKSRERMSLEQIETVMEGSDAPRRAFDAHLAMMQDDLAISNAKGLVAPILFLDQRFGLPDQMLMKVDATSMANSLEVRVPFIDHRVVEFAARLPDRLKQRGLGNRRTKKILRRYLARRFPPAFVHRRKLGLDLPLGPALLNRISDDMMSQDGGSSTSPMIQGILRRAAASFPTMKSNAIWSLYALSMWNRGIHRTSHFS